MRFMARTGIREAGGCTLLSGGPPLPATFGFMPALLLFNVHLVPGSFATMSCGLRFESPSRSIDRRRFRHSWTRRRVMVRRQTVVSVSLSSNEISDDGHLSSLRIASFVDIVVNVAKQRETRADRDLCPADADLVNQVCCQSC